jgi:ribosomal-protein-alanine N-acetyltransferase
MHVALPQGAVRDWRSDDAVSLAHHANDRRIWRNLRDRFPYPYEHQHAEAFLAFVAAMSPRTFFAVEIDGEAAGGIGYVLHDDVERVSAEIGYWLGTAHWGKGVMTEAVRAVTAHAFDHHSYLNRIYAVPFAWSQASARVLEKCGYTLEGRMRQSAIKDGELTDQLMYGITRNDARKS